MAGVTYEVTTATPDSVRVDLCRLWRDNLKVQGDPATKFDWLYRGALEPADRVFLLRALEGDGASVVGTCGVSIRRFWIDGGPARVGVVGDLAVDAPHRGLLPALRVLRSVHAHLAEDLDVGYGFPNEKAEGVMLRAGFRLLGRARRLARVLRHAGYAERVTERWPKIPPPVGRILQRPAVAGVAGRAVDLALLSRGAPRAARSLGQHRFAWLRGFDARFDRLWEAARGEYLVIGERSRAFLAWRHPTADVAALFRRGSEELLAYAIVELDPATGAAHLRDVFGHAVEIGPLLDLLLVALYLRGATSVSVRFLGAPGVAHELEQRGFQLREEGRAIVVAVGARQEARRALLEDPRSYHLFDEDEDV